MRQYLSKIILGSALLAVLMVTTPTPARAFGLSSFQVQSIITLLRSFGVGADSLLSSVLTALTGQDHTSPLATGALSCLESQHPQSVGGTMTCVGNKKDPQSCRAIQCDAGMQVIGHACNQQCVPASSTSLNVSIEQSSVVAGNYYTPGGTLTITWNAQNAPSGSVVSLYLVPSDNSDKTLLTTGQSTTGTYSWKESSMCNSDSTDCDEIFGLPGTYTIEAELEASKDACHGPVCPLNSTGHKDPKVLSLAQSSVFTVTPNPSGLSTGSIMGTTVSQHGKATDTSSTSGTLLVTSAASAGLTINVVWSASVANAPAAFKPAFLNVVNYFTSHYSDPVTITIQVGYGESGGQTLGGGMLGSNGSYYTTYSYTQVLNNIKADAKTADDALAVSMLPSTDPLGNGSYYVFNSLAKAIGLSPTTYTVDASNGFSSTAAFDYDPSDGISGGYDFQAVVLHEISHALGREICAGACASAGNSGHEIGDLFYYAASGVRATNTNGGSFSFDGGKTMINRFSTASDLSDWAGDTNDANNAFANGTLMPFSEGDLQQLDVFGYDRITPSTNVTATLSASPTAITSGNSVTLTWSSMNSTSCSGTNFTASGTSGSITVTPAQTTTYAITCTGNGGSASQAATVTVSIPDTQAPSVPTNVSVNAVSSSQINLSWTAATDNVGVTGYKVYRNGALVGSLNGTSYSDTNLSAVTTYSYTVAATDAAGNLSAQSTAVSATTSVTPLVIMVGSRVHTTSNLNIRNKANISSGKILCTQPTGALGTITSGPTSAQGYIWWNINFDTGCDGWGAQTYISL